jgi:hypothetical protein
MTKMKFAAASLALTFSMGMSGTADARGSQFQLNIDKDGVQFGPSLDPRQHGYEHAYRDGADRGRFDLEHGIRYNLNARVYNDNARGYEPFMGNKKLYQQGYREGYKAAMTAPIAVADGMSKSTAGRKRTELRRSTRPIPTRRGDGEAWIWLSMLGTVMV